MNSQNDIHEENTSFPLEELSWLITKNASIVSEYLSAHDLPQPSFRADGPSSTLPKDSPRSILQARQNLMEASLKIFQLAIGPSEFLPNLATGFQYVSSLSWLCHFKIFHLVPVDGTISYVDLADRAKVPEQRLKSIIRMAMTNMLFLETGRGEVSHSATSALFVRNPDVYAWATYMCANSAPTAMSMAAAHERWGPDSVQKNETAYNVAFGTDLPFFDHIAQDEAKISEFAAYMRNVTSSEGVDIKHLVGGYRWADLGNGKVVDVGGSSGNAAIALANEFPDLSFVVQDLPVNIKNGRESAVSLVEDIGSRITFQSHDFTQPQPVKDADVYLLRMILHDWPDHVAVEILKNIVSAMSKPNSKLLIMDSVLPSPGAVPTSVERVIRVRDLTMMQAFNSKERDLDGWKQLLKLADDKLRLVDVTQPCGSSMSILEVVLEYH
ncbi:S-adenosyl-L-methionine-dependent methyltransferase [Xylaria longipes]|nr:S-adenosyl-L-methionine-dependent methyltransferase [Xylaria longipes]